MNKKVIATLGLAVLGAVCSTTVTAQDNGVPYQVHRNAWVASYAYGVVVQFNTDAAVPAGKRLIVETVSARSWLPVNQSPVCTLQQNGVTMLYIPKLVPMHPVLASTNQMESHTAFMTKTYINSGDFRVNCDRKVQGGDGWVNIVISGTLVDAQ